MRLFGNFNVFICLSLTTHHTFAQRTMLKDHQLKFESCINPYRVLRSLRSRLEPPSIYFLSDICTKTQSNSKFFFYILHCWYCQRALMESYWTEVENISWFYSSSTSLYISLHLLLLDCLPFISHFLYSSLTPYNETELSLISNIWLSFFV